MSCLYTYSSWFFVRVLYFSTPRVPATFVVAISFHSTKTFFPFLLPAAAVTGGGIELKYATLSFPFSCYCHRRSRSLLHLRSPSAVRSCSTSEFLSLFAFRCFRTSCQGRNDFFFFILFVSRQQNHVIPSFVVRRLPSTPHAIIRSMAQLETDIPSSSLSPGTDHFLFSFHSP